jgi:hypothetical protein
MSLSEEDDGFWEWKGCSLTVLAYFAIIGGLLLVAMLLIYFGDNRDVFQRMQDQAKEQGLPTRSKSGP